MTFLYKEHLVINKKDYHPHRKAGEERKWRTHTHPHSLSSTKYVWSLNIRKMFNLINNQNKAN